MNNNFAREKDRLINLHSESNQIFNVYDYVYVIFWSDDNYHIPLIGKGQIVADKFISPIDKIYHIKIKELLHNNDDLTKYFFGTDFIDQEKKRYRPNKKMLGEEVFHIEQNGFFVRSTFEEIKSLHKFYTDIIKDNLNEKINQLNEFTKRLEGI